METCNLDYIGTILRQISNFVNLSVDCNKGKEVHRFRLAYKRLKTLLALVDFVNNTKTSKKRVKVFRQIYKATGKLRDAFILQSKIKHVNVPLKEKVLLKKYSKKRIDRTKKILNRKLLSLNPKRVNQSIAGLEKIFFKESNVFSAKNCRDFIRKHRLIVVQTLLKGTTDESFHQARKMVKVLVYTYSVIKWEGQMHSQEPRDFEMLNGFQEKLGVFNDWKNISQTLRNENNRRKQFVETEWVALVEKEKLREVLILLSQDLLSQFP